MVTANLINFPRLYRELEKNITEDEHAGLYCVALVLEDIAEAALGMPDSKERRRILAALSAIGIAQLNTN